jgi:hypothetical protein
VNLLALRTLAQGKIMGTFVAQSIWIAWEVVKPKLTWKSDSLRSELSFNEHCIW